MHKIPSILSVVKKIFAPITYVMEHKYFMDDLYLRIFAPFSRFLGRVFWQVGDTLLIDGLIVNGSAKVVGFFAKVFRKPQTGYVNSYATFMVLGLILLLTIFTQLALS